jgi:creatinine amidohydrolase/Fe(II)-dependent formamide hydrolase-like protein
MKRTSTLFFAAAISLIAQTQSNRVESSRVEFELMTWPELKHAIHEEGKTTVLVFNGGTEQRGPQGVAGAHNLVGRELAREIALKLGNAIVAPVLPYSVNNASAELPGTIGLTGPIFAAVNERVAEQLIGNGFRNVVLMGDHGGGQRELEEVAKKLDAKYAPQGARVVYCGDLYSKAGTEFNKWLSAHDLPVGSHASIKDTSELWYLGGDKGWIRKDQIPNAVGDATHKNGISGDARKASPEIGKVISEMKVEYAVAQIRQLLGTNTAAAAGQ